jgi:hypothetical protein
MDALPKLPSSITLDAKLLVPLYRAVMDGRDWSAALTGLALAFGARMGHVSIARHANLPPVFSASVAVRALDRTPPWLDNAIQSALSLPFANARAFAVPAGGGAGPAGKAHALGVRVLFGAAPLAPVAAHTPAKAQTAGSVLLLLLARPDDAGPFDTDAEWALSLIAQHLERAAGGLAPAQPVDRSAS